MDWGTIVNQLGWQDLLSPKSDQSEPVIWNKEATSDSNDDQQGKNPFRSMFNKIPKMDTSKTQMNTNPFLDFASDEEEADGAKAENKTASITDGWFYLDPRKKEHGPCDTDQMSTWYEAGYFDERVLVRHASESQFKTIAEQTKMRASFLQSSLESNLIPVEYVDRVVSNINPFILPKSVPIVKQDLVVKENVVARNEPDTETHLFNITRKFGALTLEDNHRMDAEASISPPTTPIKFNIGKLKQLKITEDEKENRNLTRSPIQTSLQAKFDMQQKYWLDVAQSKLRGPKRAQCIVVELFGEKVEAIMEADSRVSCIGVGSIKFVQSFKLTVTPLRSIQRFIRNENGANTRIYGHVCLPIKYAGRQVDNFKVLVVPELENFLYLGADFDRTFKREKRCISLIPDTSHRQQSSVDIPRQLLDKNQSKILTETITMFDCITKLGLGIANVEAHKIEIIQNEKFFQNHVVQIAADSNNVKAVNSLVHGNVIELQTDVQKYAITTDYNQGSLAIAIMLHLKKINAVIKDDCFPLKKKSEILNHIQTSFFISCINLEQINWQIPLAEESRKYTAFEMNGSDRYQFQRVPLGLKNFPQRLHRIMHEVFSTELSFHYAIVSDELIIMSRDFQKHIRMLAEVAQKLKMAQIRVNVARSTFGQSKIKCFGYIVGSNYRMVDPDAWKCITSITPPNTKHQLAKFLQIADWFRAFIMQYAKVQVPLLLLINNSQVDSAKLFLSGESLDAFADIKRHLTNNYELPGPDYTKPFHVQCHVNFEMIAGVLYQEVGDLEGSKRPVAYWISELSKQQQDYSITELECLALVTVLKHFQPYLHNEHFYVYTDKQIIEWALQQTHLSERLSIWCLQLHAYNFTLKKRPAATVNDNPAPPTTSARRLLKFQIIEELSDLSKPHLDYELLREQLCDSPNMYPDYKEIHGLIYCRRTFESNSNSDHVWKLFIPAKLRSVVIERVHTNLFGGHRSAQEMLNYLQGLFYWPSMMVDVEKMVRKCTKCNDRD